MWRIYILLSAGPVAVDWPSATPIALYTQQNFDLSQKYMLEYIALAAAIVGEVVNLVCAPNNSVNPRMVE